MGDEDKGFLQAINDSSAGQLLSLASNFSGTLQGISMFISLFQESDTDRILDAIGQLRAELDSDFRQLGDLITQQTEIIVNTVNRDAMATALSHTDVANQSLQTFLGNKDQAVLNEARAEAGLGVAFFTELGLNSTDLVFFLPGLIKAGTIYIFTMAAQKPNPKELASAIDQINNNISFLGRMISDITQAVSSAHAVVEKQHTVHCPIPPGGRGFREVTVIDGFSHQERGSQLQFFPVPDLDVDSQCKPQNPKLVEAARSAAQKAMADGIAAELAFLAIPQYQQILDSWKAFVVKRSAGLSTAVGNLGGRQIIT